MFRGPYSPPMSESAQPSPGPNTEDSRRAVRRELRESDWPVTAGDIAGRDGFNYSRRTVQTRLEELEEENEWVEKKKIGGSPSYRAREPETSGRINIRMVKAYLRPLGFKAAFSAGFMGWVSIFSLLATVAIVLLPMNNNWAILTAFMVGCGFTVYILAGMFSAEHTDVFDKYDIMDSFGENREGGER